MVYLPEEVIVWVDTKAAARFRRRASHIADLLIAAYEREHREPREVHQR